MSELRKCLRLMAAAIALAAAGHTAQAADISADWATIQMPPAPTLKAATVDPKTIS